MIFDKESFTHMESRFRNARLIFPEIPEAPRVPEGIPRGAFEDLKQLLVQLRTQATNLQAQNRQLEEYAHCVAHDLKEPLAVMVVTSDLLCEIPNLTKPELKEYLDQIRVTAHEMSKIIDNLLLFAELDKADAPVGPVDMAQVIANVLGRLNPMIRKNEAKISLPRDWPEASGFGPWIEEVWANYISNAIKHGGQPPQVELGASVQPDSMIRFWVRDNGAGLPPDAREDLFTPFSQINLLHKTGHGLGLSIVLHIVEKLGGQVGCESEPGQGCLFFFSLPAIPAGLSQEPHSGRVNLSLEPVRSG
jgi:two-component system, sensor histidine kinase and response regulator